MTYNKIKKNALSEYKKVFCSNPEEYKTNCFDKYVLKEIKRVPFPERKPLLDRWFNEFHN